MNCIRRQTWLYDQKHDSMLWQYRKIALFLLRAITKVSGIRYKFMRTSWEEKFETIRLNLGCGRDPLPDWVNVDINPFSLAEVVMDLRDTWPFKENQVEVSYARHCLEHFTEKEVLKILAKCYQVLKSGKGLRIGVPSLEYAIELYQNQGFTQFPWSTVNATSRGRQFSRYIMDNGGHHIMLDYGYLAELLELTGFSCIKRVQGGQSNYIETRLLSPKDHPQDATTLYVECIK